MRIARFASTCWLAFGLLAAAKKDEPEVTVSKFSGPQTNLFFFDDSETVLAIDKDDHSLRISKDAGAKWDIVEDVPEGKVEKIQSNLFDNQVAIAYGKEKTHWITYDQGKNWRSFKVPENPSFLGPAASFHAADSKRILYHAEEDCMSLSACYGTTYYTDDGFKNIEVLHEDRVNCLWAKSEPLFTTGDEKRDRDSAVCIVKGRTPAMKDCKLVTSDNYFKTEHEVVMSSGRTITGMINVAAVKGFIVAAAKAPSSKEMALFVTKDATTWHRAEFGDQRVEQDAYTVLESTNYSIQVDVQTDRYGALGDLYTSNTNGTYFTRNIQHVNRDDNGYVDFERIQNIQGIILINEIDNWQDVSDALGSIFSQRKIKSKISFDDGHTWSTLDCDGEELHIHSVTEQINSGRIFSSQAPGILLANGNTGKHLGELSKSRLYVSDDAGKTWRDTGLKGAHKYEFGDSGSILLAVARGEADEFAYSLNHGKDWKTVDFPESGYEVLDLTTIPDSTSLKFILEAIRSDGKYRIVSIDFEGLHERTCESDDFEKWYARTDKNGEPQCIMGHTQSFRRRKANADCFVKKEFKDPVPLSEPCDCTDEDFECDYNFKPSSDGKSCEQAGKLVDSDDQCKSPEDTFKGSSGYRLKPGNDCKRTKGIQKDDPIERDCKKILAPPATGKVDVEITPLPAEVKDWYYLERNENSAEDDETIVILTATGRAYITYDHGKEWAPIIKDATFVSIYSHTYNNDYIYLIEKDGTVHYSEDRGKTFHNFKAPNPPAPSATILTFHPKEYDWIIWTGEKCEHNECHNVASVSYKNGDDFKTLLRYSQRCQFMFREDLKDTEDLIYCERHMGENPKAALQLISTKDEFKTHEVLFENVVSYASMSEFVIVASKVDDGLQVQASLDGTRFAHAAWPPKFKVERETAYTVLDSSTHSIFLHVTVSGKEGREYGSIMKSNSNGTSYVLALDYVNRDTDGFVDFEKLKGIEGAAVVNTVYNHEQVDAGEKKQLKSMITHDDGADWEYITPPKKDLDGKPFCQDEDIEDCSLHLHGFTERKDNRDGYSSPAAVGMMIAIGNVGKFLGPKSEGDTFLSADAGITWNQIQKGSFIWEYGDQGSVIVLVEQGKTVSSIKYSTNDGETWEDEELGVESPMEIGRITTVPSDNSRNFLLWGVQDGKFTTINVDFTGLADKQCNLDKENPESKASDYYLWSPVHPLKSEEKECLFGHVSRYYRKKTDRNCYNGPMIEKLHDIARNCSCTRQDFECDYNYQRIAGGSCALIPGLEPANPLDQCSANPDQYQYYDITGYRKIPISTCSGGRELQYASPPKPCPGHEEEFNRKTGISGVGLFFAIVIPIGAAAGVGYYVWKNWDGKFGQIRLGESSGFDFGSAFDSDSPFVKYPVAAVSAIVAVVAAIPLLVASLFRSVRSRFPGAGRGNYSRVYNSRSSFARGGQDYSASPVEDEGELLGDESDEEV